MAACDWVVAHDATCGDLAMAMQCKRCGDVQRVALPIAIDLYAVMAKEYERLHSSCKELTEACRPNIDERRREQREKDEGIGSK